MALVYRSTKNKRIVSKRYAIKHPDLVTSAEAHPSPSSKSKKGR